MEGNRLMLWRKRRQQSHREVAAQHMLDINATTEALLLLCHRGGALLLCLQDITRCQGCGIAPGQMRFTEGDQAALFLIP